MHSETGFPSSHQLKSYVASKSRLKLAARAVLSADAGLLVELRFYLFSKRELTFAFAVCVGVCEHLCLVRSGVGEDVVRSSVSCVLCC